MAAPGLHHGGDLAVTGIPATMTAVVDGRWSPAGAGPLHDVLDPSSGEAIARFEESSAGLVDAAVRSGERAWQGAWARTSPADRGRILLRCAEAVHRHAAALARLESLDTGKPLSQARADIDVSARYLEYYAGACDKLAGQTLSQPAGTFAYTLHEPYGVIAHITPWNAPLSQMMRGVAPSLAAGNAVVVKPSELTPLTTALAAVLLVEAGLPEGLCNVVLGPGSTVGEELVRHPLVQRIAFTGSVATGRHVGRAAADRVVGCNLELGGKSPTIVCADADLPRAAAAGALAVVRNSGQSCFATTRLLVDRTVHDRFVELVAAQLEGLTLGPGLEDPDLGPLVSQTQRDRVLSLVEDARADGAHVVAGGTDGGRSAGWFVAPTLLAGVTSGMPIAQTEVFGPVQSVLAFNDLDEAVRMANDTPYGLSAGVFTADLGRAHRLASALQAGQVQINRYTGAGVEIPFGGYKQSGIGREKGMDALLHYSQVKSVIVALD
jgi:acyl-CoA reductase-like NAD-dependent aldehyde dehydrogenase